MAASQSPRGCAVLRRILLAASDSGRMRQLVTSAPLARGVVARYVAGDEAADAVSVAGRLHADGLLISLDHLGEDTRDARQADLVTQEYTTLLARDRKSTRLNSSHSQISYAVFCLKKKKKTKKNHEINKKNKQNMLN